MNDTQVRTRLAAAGLDLPVVDAPRSRYVPMRISGAIAFCAGVTSDGMTGTVGVDATTEQAVLAAEHAALRQLAYIESELGSLDAVHAVLRLTGYVACATGFGDAPVVIDAASAVFLTAFGDDGRHARSAVGVAGLPLGALVELEAVLALRGVDRA
ncbi:MAG: Endoribonuclease [Pseudonocardiales bacterium]|nr:Endoribonuclease [Pseudonocardiales bacterium]